MHETKDSVEVFDVVGIGFGPANLALAVAVEETPAPERPSCLFLESKPEHAWHPGMLITDSLLQITVLKDLILVENPCSSFTFLSYLKEKGRLYEFLNLRDLFPTRLEFNDYLGWAADRLCHRVRYGNRVESVRETDAEGEQLLEIATTDLATGEPGVVRARHLVLAAGGKPVVPRGVRLEPGGRAFHSHEFKQRIAEFDDREAPHRFVVVGGGQSAGEIFEYLIDHFPNADVTATTRRFAYKPVDESDFTNRIFFPEWVDFYHQLPPAKRRALFAELADVNYAVIDQPLIRRLYQKLYRQKVEGRERARLRPFLELLEVEEQGGGTVALRMRDTMREEEETLVADGVVLCTGFAWQKEHPLLDALASRFERDDLGGYRVERDYGIASRPGFDPRVYLQGYCEDTHGISETVLSLLPVRAADILRSIRERCRDGDLAAPVGAEAGDGDSIHAETIHTETIGGETIRAETIRAETVG